MRYSPRVIIDVGSSCRDEYAASSCICPIVSSQPDLSGVRHEEAVFVLFCFVLFFALTFQQDSPLEIARNESIHQSADPAPVWF